MYEWIPSSLSFLQNLIRAAYPSIVNSLDENVQSNFVWEIINISKLPLMLFKSISNLFRIEFMFMWPIINLLILAMRVVFSLLRKGVLSLLSSFSSIKLIKMIVQGGIVYWYSGLLLWLLNIYIQQNRWIASIISQFFDYRDQTHC